MAVPPVQAFTPTGPTMLVAATAVQIGAGGSWRVHNLSSSVQYFTTGATSGVLSVGAPSAGVPSANTLGMLPDSIEIFGGLGLFMIASSATGFNVTQGEGM